MADIDPRHKKIIINIIKMKLSKAKIYAFGSRVKGTNKKYSDLDIALDNSENTIDLSVKSQLEEALAQTAIPYKVDLVDLSLIDSDFKKNIFLNYEEWT